MPPQTNATLKKVEGPAPVDTWQAGDGSADLWTGSERVYFNERRLRQTAASGGGQRRDFTTTRSLFVDIDVPIEFAEGQVLTICRDRASVDEKCTVMSTRSSDAPAEQATPPELATVKVELDEPQPASP